MNKIIISIIGLIIFAGCDKKPASTDTNTSHNNNSKRINISDFEIVNYRGQWDDGRFRIIGELKNNGKIAAGAQIEVIARDDSGMLIDSQSFWPNSINNIEPGSSCGIGSTITNDKRAITLEAKVIRVEIW